MIQFDDIQSLIADAKGPVLSLYLQINPAMRENQAPTPAWRIWMKNALKKLEQKTTDNQRDVWQSAHNRAVDYVDNNELTGKALVMFVGEEIERIYSLPLHLPQPAATFGQPSVAPLMWLIDEYEPYLVVFVDSEEAQFMTTYLGNTSEEANMTSERFDYDFGQKTKMARSLGPRAQGGGTSTQGGNQRDKYEDMIQEHVDSFYRDVAAKIHEMMKQKTIKRLILGGSKQSAAAISDVLNAKAKEALVDIVPVPMRASEQEVYQGIIPTALEYERKHEEELVREIINMAKAGGRAVLGREAVLKALEQKRVELLVAPWPLENSDLVDRLPLQVLEAGSEVEMVYGQAAQHIHDEGGLAARLYYTV